jgi:hypothetical protein
MNHVSPQDLVTQRLQMHNENAYEKAYRASDPFYYTESVLDSYQFSAFDLVA